MNDSFFQLPEEKQQRIINAAYKVFSESEYKKAPMSEIAGECGISKALLFHYFTNKKELYLYLYQHAKEITEAAAAQWKVGEADDFFDMMSRNIKAKCCLMNKYPYICAFSLKAYYERIPDVSTDVQAILAEADKGGLQAAAAKLDVSRLKPGIDVQLMYQEIRLACEGYLYHMYRSSNINVQQMEKDFKAFIAHWKKVYEKEGAE